MPAAAPSRVDGAGIVIAAALLALAAIVWWDMTGLGITSVYGLGPKAMPGVIAIGLAMLAAGNLVLAVRGRLPPREHTEARPILLILGGLLALIAIIAAGGGFIAATAILFAMTAAGFGRRAFVVDLVIGAVLGTLVYLLFVKLLTLALPAGPLERLL